MSMGRDYILFLLLLFPFAGAAVSWLIGRKDGEKRNLAAEIVAIIEFAAFFILFLLFFAGREGGFRQMYLKCSGFGMGLHLCLDGFRALYCMVAAFMWMMTSLFSREYFGHYQNRNRYYLFMLLTLGATTGVFLSADLYTTFIFFEIMSFTSYVWVAHDETREALRSAETYLAVAVIGGLVMLMGIFLLYDMFGTLEISELSRRVISMRAAAAVPSGADVVSGVSMTRLYVAGGCLLFGFGAKAGAFPLHIWLPKAHPVAPAPASALLSGILTKTGIFGIIAVTASLFLYDEKWGSLVLFLGVVTMVLGAVLALFSIDLKRTLACSSVSQIGFILTGIGMMVLLRTENAMAARGTLLHMVNHSLFKLVLFMAAGAVYMRIHKLDLNAVRGFGRGKYFLGAVFLAGALGIGGIPGFSGYVSKTLLHESIVEYRECLEMGSGLAAANGFTAFFTSAAGMNVVEILFLFSGGLTIAYMTKLFIAIFVEKNADARVQERYDEIGSSFMSMRSRIALGVSAALILILGVFPHQLMDSMAALGEGFLGSSGMAEEVSFVSFANMKGAFISLAIGLIVYAGFVRTVLMKKQGEQRVYANRWPAWLDLENLVYRPLLCTVLPFIGGVISRVLDRLLDGIIVFLRKTVYKDSPIPHELDEGTWMTHMLGSFLDKVELLFHNHTDHEHELAMVHEDFSENRMIIGRSLSFGLFMACIGLILTLLYLLI